MTLFINGVATAVLVDTADSFAKRVKGLLGKKEIPVTYAMGFKNCGAIHTFFMLTAIDVIMTGKDGRVLALAEALGPWKYMCNAKAVNTIELAQGVIHQLGIQKNDLIEIK